MAGLRNISIYKGDTYTHQVTIQDSTGTAIDISGRSYSGQIRKASGSDTVVATFATALTDPTNGVLQITLSSSVTSSIQAGTYVYDLQETNGSNVLTLMYGDVTVSTEVTRA